MQNCNVWLSPEGYPYLDALATSMVTLRTGGQHGHQNRRTFQADEEQPHSRKDLLPRCRENSQQIASSWGQHQLQRATSLKFVPFPRWPNVQVLASRALPNILYNDILVCLLGT
ncbi:uncharacterized protein LOC134761961 isoform X1 [Pongo abelii]|uniref:uncharacterized protein LOC134761961 isoform X1 n=1 Tax=Pongo abelii TaxID=9601 RepID=UPI00300421C7